MATTRPILPSRRTCGAAEVHHRLLERPDYQARQIALERHVARFLLFDGHTRRTGVVTIPTVVHVVYKENSENISDAQIQSEFPVLNADYRALNADISKVPGVWKGLIGDALIEFKLATSGPDGRASSGIERIQTTVASFGTDDAVKSAAKGGADPWLSDRYLNVWVCTLSGGLLGYAQFPGGPTETDGVVILNTAFGTMGTAAAPFNQGRTSTHEIGHWLNLYHIWGDRLDCKGTDYVDDTPPAQSPNYGKPTFPHITCNNGPNGDMFTNYMDYVDDDSMFMFTLGQVARMSATLDGARTGFFQATAPAVGR